MNKYVYNDVAIWLIVGTSKKELLFKITITFLLFILVSCIALGLSSWRNKRVVYMQQVVKMIIDFDIRVLEFPISMYTGNLYLIYFQHCQKSQISVPKVMYFFFSSLLIRQYVYLKIIFFFMVQILNRFSFIYDTFCVFF